MTTSYRFSRPAPRGPLWALEASAGTGKTWTIENFVADYLADPAIAPEDIVIVTFTKAATAELRSRIRSNIVAITKGVDATLPHRDYTDEERSRLRAVISDYSSLRISTIHGFAQRCLALLGEPVGELSIIQEDEEFLTSVMSDAVRSLDNATVAHLQASDSYFDDAVAAFQALQNNPSAVVRTASTSHYDLAMVALLSHARSLLTARKNNHGLLSMSDLLLKLDTLLSVEHNARTVAHSIKVLLIDEFQDTDSLQWSIFKKISDCGLLHAFVVVGDPKQAIYGFRGGDVQVYREAVDPASAQVLDGNRRSTSVFVSAMNEYFSGTDFGLSFGNDDGSATLPDGSIVRPAEISYYAVKATGDLASVTEGPGWYFREATGGSASERREQTIADMPSYIKNLRGRFLPDSKTGVMRELRLSDICILMNSNAHNAAMARTLISQGVPATLYGGANVFSSEAAIQWRHLLLALQRPTSTSAICLFAWTWFGGASVAEVMAGHDDEEWLAHHQQRLLTLHDAFGRMKRSAFFDFVMKDTGVLPFLARMENGQRTITDTQHVAEILRRRQNESLSQLHDFLVRANTAVDDEAVDSEIEGGDWSRRIDGDTDAVQIMTIHKAKGLQFPVVLIPYLTNHPGRPRPFVVYRSYADGKGTTYLDLARKSDDIINSVYSAQRASEVRRKAYVALTRGQVHNVIWTWDASRADDRPVLRDKSWHSAAATQSDAFNWDSAPLDSREVPEPSTPSLALASLQRALPVPPRRHSFTSLARSVSRRGAHLEPDYEPEGADEGSVPPQAPTNDLFQQLRGSTRLGKAIHAVLEDLSTGAVPHTTPLEDVVAMACVDHGVVLRSDGTSGVSLEDATLLVRTALNGDLGSVSPGQSLSSFHGGRTIAEMDFDLTLPAPVSTGAFFDILREHLAGDPLFGPWIAAMVVTPATLSGFLTGSIDAVLIDGEPESPRFVVVDYKTNRLETPRGIYQALIDTMNDHNYFLQGLIYLVALHRYLRSRLGSSYQYEHHVGGAGYLFLRAMSPDVAGAGIVHLTPPSACIEALSNFFDGGAQ